MRSIALFLATVLAANAQQLQKITINYATRTAQVWPLYIAKEGGYYQKYGLDAKLVFAIHPAAVAMVVSGEAVMTPYTLEQSMTASYKDGSLVSLGSPFKKSLFALMATKDIKRIQDLKGKRIGVSQVGDAPYNYTNGLIAKAGLKPRDVQWIPTGGDVSTRATALLSGRVDATMITAPVYFKVEEQGYSNLGNISDYDDIFAPSVYLFRKATIAGNPKLPELLMKAHAEAIKRFYDDKAFAVKAYQVYDKQTTADVERFYDGYAKANVLERVPYVMAGALQAVIDQQSDAKLLAQMKGFDFHTVIDNSVVDRLVNEGYFQKLFGPGIKAEEARKAKIAFK